MTVLLSFVTALLVSTITLPLCRKHAGWLGLLDDSSAERKMHSGMQPRSGGLAIVAGTVVAAILWLPPTTAYVPLFACISLVALAGLLDDIFDLHYLFKFLAQIVATAVLLAWYGYFPQVPFYPLDAGPLWLSAIISFVFIVGVTNAVNLSDGLDGLAAGNSLLSYVVLVIFAAQIDADELLVVALAVTGGLLGFLRFNTHPSSIFMGDLGSQFIGFTAAALTLLIFVSEQLPISPMIPVLIFGLPILDTLMVIGLRAYARRPLFSADRRHLHHQLLAMGLYHYEVVTVLYVLQAVTVSIAYVYRFESDLFLFTTYVTFAGTVLGLVAWVRWRGWRLHGNADNDSTDRRNHWLRRLNWYQKHTAKVISGFLGLLFIVAAVFADPIASDYRTIGWMAVVGLCLIWMLFARYPDIVCRVIGYSGAALAIFSWLFGIASEPYLLWADMIVILLLGSLVLAIRLTRRQVFQLDTQDYLVVLIVVVSPLFMPSGVDGFLLTRLVIYLAVMFYACEYVVTKGHRTKWLINIAGIGAISASLV